MPRRKKTDTQKTELKDSNNESQPQSDGCGLSKSGRSKRNRKKGSNAELTSVYFDSQDKTVISKTVTDTSKQKKSKEPKVNKNKGRKSKELLPKTDEISDQCPINNDNDSDPGISEYFSPNQKKKLKTDSESQKASLAAKIKANMSVDEDSDFENDDIAATAINNKAKTNTNQKKNTSGNSKSSVLNKKTKETKATDAIPDKQKRKSGKKVNNEKESKDVEISCVKPDRKRRSTEPSTDVIPKKRTRAGRSKKGELTTTGFKEQSVDQDKDSEVKDKLLKNVNKKVLNGSGDLKQVLNNETVNSVIDKHDQEHISSKTQEDIEVMTESDDSSDDEMMDVETDTPEIKEINKSSSITNLKPMSESASLTAPSTVNKPLPKVIDESDPLALLLHMEGAKPSCSTNDTGRSTDRSDVSHKMAAAAADDDAADVDMDDESEEEDWEDVADAHGSSPKKSQIPQGGVEVKFDAPEIYKKRKRGEFDLQAYFKRQINKFKREVAMDIHKVHLLCLLARCRYLNTLCQEEVVQAQALSITLVTKELHIKQSLSCTEQHLNQVLTWIRSNQQYLLEVTEQSLQTVSGDLRIVMICVILLRQVGFLTRLMMSLQPIPFRTSAVSKTTASKKGKSVKNGTSKKKNSTVNKDSKSSIKKEKSTTKDKKTSVKTPSIKHEPDTDNDTSKQSSKKRKSRRCSKVSKDAYHVDGDSDDDRVDDIDMDDDYKPEIEETDKKTKKSTSRRRSSGMKEEKDVSAVKDEQLSDSDFEADSVVIRSQQLKKLSPSPKNRKVVSEDEECTHSGVDYWIEVYLKKEQRWICVDGTSMSVKKSYEIENTASQPVCYVVGITQENYMKDVTARYASQWLTETRKSRVEADWWAETLRPYLNPDSKLSEREDEELNLQLQKQPLPTSISAFKNHPLYALRRHLLKFEALYPDTAIPVGYIRGEPVYARECVHTLHSRENWLKEGRAVRIGEESYKFVKSRPKWNRPKEDPEAKDLELFGHWQTEVYIPPPAVDGVVPRNAHGNVEMFQPSMLPAGTVHLKVPGLNKVAKKLDIDCAPAMVGWEHHCGFSHPLMDGWIVCEEHKDILLAAWDEEQEIIREKEQQKREKRVYENWRKLIRGMLIKERLKKRFDLDDKPVECTEPQPSVDESKNSETIADDAKHSWPQNRIKNKSHTLCVVESM